MLVPGVLGPGMLGVVPVRRTRGRLPQPSYIVDVGHVGLDVVTARLDVVRLSRQRIDSRAFRRAGWQGVAVLAVLLGLLGYLR